MTEEKDLTDLVMHTAQQVSQELSRRRELVLQKLLARNLPFCRFWRIKRERAAVKDGSP